MPERLSMTGLQRAAWTFDDAENEDLAAALGRVGHLGGSVQGIAYTTAGARAIRSASDHGLRDTGGNEVRLGTVYELRLWAVAQGAGGSDGVLARELRWLNGTGSVEVVLRTCRGGAAAPGEPCWYRPNAYLQHDEEENAGKAPTMEAVEIFVEADYGNTVFADELMTGRWN